MLQTPPSASYSPFRATSVRAPRSSSAATVDASGMVNHLKQQLMLVESEIHELVGGHPRRDAPSSVPSVDVLRPSCSVSSEYKTITLKEAQIESVVKLKPGNKDANLNWHFQARTQLEALDLLEVAESGVTSSSDSHRCGPRAARDLHRFCLGMIRDQPNLMTSARNYFLDSITGPALWKHLCVLYVSSSERSSRRMPRRRLPPSIFDRCVRMTLRKRARSSCSILSLRWSTS